MGIDWFTFVAQIINFLILVFLLRRFLYGPIVRAMEEREAEIANRISEADRQFDEANQSEAAWREKNEQIEEQQKELLVAARRAADEKQRELINEARTAVDSRRAAWYESLEREQQSTLQEIRRETGMRAIGIARQALRDFADRDLHDQIVSVFVRRLGVMEPGQQAELTRAVALEGKIVVTTAFTLSDDAERRVAEALQSHFDTRNDITFRQTDEVMCGLEVRIGGHQVSWSFDDFLDSIGVRFEKELAARRHTQPVRFGQA